MKNDVSETDYASFFRHGKYLLWWAPYLDSFAQRLGIALSKHHSRRR